jgi:hypothetical protein
VYNFEDTAAALSFDDDPAGAIVEPHRGSKRNALPNSQETLPGVP